MRAEVYIVYLYLGYFFGFEEVCESNIDRLTCLMKKINTEDKSYIWLIKYANIKESLLTKGEVKMEEEKHEEEKHEEEEGQAQIKIDTERVQVRSRPTSKPIWKFSRIVNFVFIVIEGFLVIRFALKFLGGNENNQIVKTIYELTKPFVLPFSDLLMIQDFVAGKIVVEISTILAIISILLIDYAIVKLIRVLAS